MVKIKHIIAVVCVILSASFISACSNSTKKVCESYVEVCEALNKEEPVDVIISLKLATDMDEFKVFLEENKMVYSTDFEVTNQILVTINEKDLLTLSESELISNIGVDSFYPR